jgi:hypothetical protein
MESADAPLGFRPARPKDWQRIVVNASLMEEEDLGHTPFKDNPRAFGEAVQRRIEREVTWVIERDGEIVFQINIGTQTTWGAQLGGTFVPRKFRGQGLAKAGTAAIVRHLLKTTRQVTLHVNEANLPAVAVYERVGFRPYARFRLATLR